MLDSPNGNLIRIFEALLDEIIGSRWIEDPSLIDTPARMAKAWGHWTGGYDADIPAILKTFPAPVGSAEMVIVKDVPFFSLCEHHGAPFFGTASVAYIPNGKVLGLSKIGRLIDAFARRLQVQERMTNEIADAMYLNGSGDFKPIGVGVIIKARHLCMESRGLSKQGQETITSALRGVISSDPTARAEFLSLAS